MGFYGNITNNVRTSFSFDRIYPNRVTLEKNAKSDGVYLGRFVLIEYDSTPDLDKDQLDYYKQIYKCGINVFTGEYNEQNQKIYEKRDAIFTVETTGTEIADTEDLDHLLKTSEYDSSKIYYYIDTNDTFHFINLISTTAELDTGDTVTFYQERSEIDNNYTANYKIDIAKYQSGRGWDSTVWQKVYKDDELTGKKVTAYAQIAELNTVVPTFDLEADPPTSVPIVPHFDIDSTNVYYKLHWQPNWGLRVAVAKNENGEIYSDDDTIWIRYNYDQSTGQGEYEYYSITEDDIQNNIDGVWTAVEVTDGLTIEQALDNLINSGNGRIPANIYYNKDGFAEEVHNESSKNDYFTLLPTGQSGYKYSTHDFSLGGSHTANDVQEFNLCFPSIGNAVCKFYDTLYGFRKNDERYFYEDAAGNKVYDSSERFLNQRFTDISWKDVTEDQINDNMTRNLETVAGTINTLHDLMGMIIKKVDSTAEVENGESNYIYEVIDTDEISYYYKGTRYSFELIDDKECYPNYDTESYFDYTVVNEVNVGYNVDSISYIKNLYYILNPFFDSTITSGEKDKGHNVYYKIVNNNIVAGTEEDNDGYVQATQKYIPDYINEYKEGQTYYIKQVNSDNPDLYSTIELQAYTPGVYYIKAGQDYLCTYDQSYDPPYYLLDNAISEAIDGFDRNYQTDTFFYKTGEDYIKDTSDLGVNIVAMGGTAYEIPIPSYENYNEGTTEKTEYDTKLAPRKISGEFYEPNKYYYIPEYTTLKTDATDGQAAFNVAKSICRHIYKIDANSQTFVEVEAWTEADSEAHQIYYRKNIIDSYANTAPCETNSVVDNAYASAYDECVARHKGYKSAYDYSQGVAKKYGAADDIVVNGITADDFKQLKLSGEISNYFYYVPWDNTQSLIEEDWVPNQAYDQRFYHKQKNALGDIVNPHGYGYFEQCNTLTDFQYVDADNNYHDREYFKLIGFKFDRSNTFDETKLYYSISNPGEHDQYADYADSDLYTEVNGINPKFGYAITRTITSDNIQVIAYDTTKYIDLQGYTANKYWFYDTIDNIARYRKATGTVISDCKYASGGQVDTFYYLDKRISDTNLTAINEVEKMYLPNLYYYSQNNSYYLSKSNVCNQYETYYTINTNNLISSGDKPFYEVSKYYYKVDNNYVLDTSSTFDENRTYYYKSAYYIKDDSNNTAMIGSIWNNESNAIPNYITLGTRVEINYPIKLKNFKSQLTTYEYTKISWPKFTSGDREDEILDRPNFIIWLKANSMHTYCMKLKNSTDEIPYINLSEHAKTADGDASIISVLTDGTNKPYKTDGTYNSSHNYDLYERLINYQDLPQTVNSLILTLNQVLDLGNQYSRDTTTVQGCLNYLNDIINKFIDPASGQTLANSGDILIIDDYGRYRGVPQTTKQRYVVTNYGQRDVYENYTTTDKGEAEDQWIDWDVNTNPVDDAPLTILHASHSEDKTTTISDKNNPNYGTGCNRFNEDYNNVKLYTPQVDNTGHVVGFNEEHVELPYGFKYITTENSTAASAWSQNDSATSSTGENTAMIAADNVKDTLAFNAGNKWLRIQTGANGSDNNYADKLNTNQTLTIAHETHDITITELSSDMNGNGDTFTVQDLAFDVAGHVTHNQPHTYTLPYGFKTITPSTQSSAVTEMITNTTSIIADNTQDTLGLATDNKWIRIANNSETDTIHFAHKISELKNHSGDGIASDRDASTWYGQSADIDFRTDTASDNTFTIPYMQFDEAGHITGIETHTIKTPETFEYIRVANKSNGVANLVYQTGKVQAEDLKGDTINLASGNTWINLSIDSVGASDGNINGGASIKFGHLVQTIETSAKETSNLNNLTGDNANQIILQDSTIDEAGHIRSLQNHTYILPYGFKTFKDADDNETVATITQDTFTFTGDNWIKPEIVNKKLKLSHQWGNEVVAERTDAQVTSKNIYFGDSFDIEDWRFDSKGHKYGLQTHTLTLPTVVRNVIGDGNLISNITLTDSNASADNELTININTIKLGDGILHSYALGTSTDAIVSTDTLSAALGKLQSNINMINGEASTAGSIKAALASANTYTDTSISNLIDSAPETLDTLKEIADWIASDETATSALVGRVGALETATSTTLPDAISIAKTEAIETAAADATSKADTAEQNAKDYADSLATNYDAAGAAATAEQNAKDYADGLATNYDVAGAAEAVQGETTSTVKEVEDRVATLEGLSIPSASDLADGMYVLKKTGDTIEWVSLDTWVGGTY